MTREEAIQDLEHFTEICLANDGTPDEILLEAIDMAIEALSAEKREEEYADEIARRIATIIENEQDMRVILKSAEIVWEDDFDKR